MSGVANLPPPSLQAMIQEVDRELATRERVYPRWIAAGKISAEAAGYRIVVLTAARERLVDLLAEERAAAQEVQP